MCECLQCIKGCGECLNGCRGIAECAKGCEEGAKGDCPKWLIQLCGVIVCIAVCFYPFFLLFHLILFVPNYRPDGTSSTSSGEDGRKNKPNQNLPTRTTTSAPANVPTGNNNVTTASPPTIKPKSQADKKKKVCINTIFVHGKNVTLNCGKKCRYDTYTKFCEDKLPCIRSSDCQAKCDANGYCAAYTVPVVNGEKQFHLSMSFIYTFFMAITCYMWQRKIVGNNIGKKWFSILLVMGTLSWIIYITAEVGATTKYNTRLFFVFLTFVFSVISLCGTLDITDIADFVYNKDNSEMFLLLIIIDITHSVIGGKQAVLHGKDELHIGIKANERCYDVEYLGYVIGTLVFGVFLYICCIIRQILYLKMLPKAITTSGAIINESSISKTAHDSLAGTIAGFMNAIKRPTQIIALVFIGFTYSCKDSGKTKLITFQITTTLFYCIFISYGIYYNYMYRKQKKEIKLPNVRILNIKEEGKGVVHNWAKVNVISYTAPQLTLRWFDQGSGAQKGYLYFRKAGSTTWERLGGEGVVAPHEDSTLTVDIPSGTDALGYSVGEPRKRNETGRRVDLNYELHLLDGTIKEREIKETELTTIQTNPMAVATQMNNETDDVVIAVTTPVDSPDMERNEESPRIAVASLITLNRPSVKEQKKLQALDSKFDEWKIYFTPFTICIAIMMIQFLLVAWSFYVIKQNVNSLVAKNVTTAVEYDK